MRKAIQVSQRERANKKKATANAHGEHCYVAYQHADKRSQRLIKQCVSIRVIVDEQYKIAQLIEDNEKKIIENDKKWRHHRTKGPKKENFGPDCRLK